MIRGETAKHFILDFTHVYQDEHVRGNAEISWIDCSDIPETNMYCSGQAYREIAKRTNRELFTFITDLMRRAGKNS